MNRKQDRPCHVLNELLEILARPWTLHILCVLSDEGPTRFGTLRRKVEGISARVLTERLRTLEEKGFLFRHYEPTVPPAVTYGLTDRVQDLKTVMEELQRLAEKWNEEDEDSGVRKIAIN